MIYFEFASDMFDTTKLKVFFRCTFYNPARKGDFTCKVDDLEESISLCVKQNMNNVVSGILSQYHTSNPIKTSKDQFNYNKVTEFVRSADAEHGAQKYAQEFIDYCAPYLKELIQRPQAFLYPQWVEKTSKLNDYAQMVAAGTPLITGQPGEAKAI